jgi:TRAP-type C4-dicarboxylate transport system substrate-binding protein
MPLSAIVILCLLIVCTAPATTSAANPAPTSAPTSPKVIHWKGQNSYVGGASGGYMPFLADWIKKRTEGRLILDVSPPGAIVPVTEQYTAVTKKALDFAGQYFAGYYTGLFPETNIEQGLPFAWQTMEEAMRAYYYYGLYEEFRKIYEEKGIKWFPAFPNAIYHLGTQFPVKSLKDIKGKKIRALGIAGNYVKLLGGSPLTLPVTDIYMASKLGTIDGCIGGMTYAEDMKLKEVWTHYIVDPNMSTLVTNYIFNLDSWNALPDDIKKIIDDELVALSNWYTYIKPITNYGIAEEAARVNGLKLVTLPSEEKVEIMKLVIPIWDSIAAKSPRCAKLVDIVKKQMRDLNRIK